jgi:hypothetical protein
MGPAMQRVITRGCRSLTVQELKTIEHIEELKQCLRDLIREAGNDTQDMRAEVTMSLRRLESYLKELALLDGPKTLVLVSAGLAADDAALDEIARLAADARATIHVIAVDRERERDRTDLANGQSELKLQDRALEMHGLETIAERTGGGLHRAIGPAEGVFERLTSELSASYVVAVERRDGDPERQRVEVDVKRRGVMLRSPRMVMTRGAPESSPLSRRRAARSAGVADAAAGSSAAAVHVPQAGPVERGLPAEPRGAGRRARHHGWRVCGRLRRHGSAEPAGHVTRGSRATRRRGTPRRPIAVRHGDEPAAGGVLRPLCRRRS